MSDLIDRDKVIEYCLKLIDVERKQGTDVMNYGRERINQTDTIIAFVENLPSARQKGDWIPCSERLPSEETSVLVTFGYGEIGIDIHTVGWANNGWVWHDDAIAWMPLPKAYEETDHE